MGKRLEELEKKVEKLTERLDELEKLNTIDVEEFSQHLQKRLKESLLSNLD